MRKFPKRYISFKPRCVGTLYPVFAIHLFSLSSLSWYTR